LRQPPRYPESTARSQQHHICWASIQHLMMMRYIRFCTLLRQPSSIYWVHVCDLRRWRHLLGKHSLHGDAPHQTLLDNNNITSVGKALTIWWWCATPDSTARSQQHHIRWASIHHLTMMRHTRFCCSVATAAKYPEWMCEVWGDGHIHWASIHMRHTVVH
jgi:hypothetical protein